MRADARAGSSARREQSEAGESLGLVVAESRLTADCRDDLDGGVVQAEAEVVCGSPPQRA